MGFPAVQRVHPARLGLWGLILAGGLLRLWDLGTKSLWVDEAQALWVAQHDPAWIRAHVARASGHESPARYFLMHFLAAASPNVEFAIRFPAFLGGVALIPIAWALAARLARSRAAAPLIAATLVTLSPTLFEHSQDARYYTVMLALVSGGLLALLAAWDHPHDWGLWIAAGLCSALGFYISFTAAFVAGATVGAAALLALRPSGAHPPSDENLAALRRGALTTLLCAAVPLGPWLPQTLRTAAQYLGLVAPPAREIALFGVPSLGAPWHPEWGRDWSGELLHPFGAGAALLAVCAALGLWRALRSDARALTPLALMALLTVALAFGTAMRSSLVPRYLLHLHLFALILCACGLAHVAATRRAGVFAAGLVAVLLAAGQLPALWRLATHERQDWRGAAAFIESRFRPGDLILTGAYWSERPILHHITDPRVRAAVTPHVMAEDDFVHLLTFNRSVWYVGWGEIPPFIQRLLDRDFTAVAVFPGTRGDVRVWKKGELPPDSAHLPPGAEVQP